MTNQPSCSFGLSATNILSEQTSHHQSVSSTFLSEQIGISHQPNDQPPAKRTNQHQPPAKRTGVQSSHTLKRCAGLIIIAMKTIYLPMNLPRNCFLTPK
jgi:hypothetical protein